MWQGRTEAQLGRNRGGGDDFSQFRSTPLKPAPARECRTRRATPIPRFARRALRLESFETGDNRHQISCRFGRDAGYRSRAHMMHRHKHIAQHSLQASGRGLGQRSPFRRMRPKPDARCACHAGCPLNFRGSDRRSAAPAQRSRLLPSAGRRSSRCSRPWPSRSG